MLHHFARQEWSPRQNANLQCSQIAACLSEKVVLQPFDRRSGSGLNLVRTMLKKKWTTHSVKKLFS